MRDPFDNLIDCGGIVAGFVVYFLVLSMGASPAPAADLSVRCSQVSGAIDHQLNVAFGDRATLVWADVMVLAGCSSGKPEEITTKTRLDDAARLARSICRAQGHDNCD
jgi:hypothetical protein